MKTSILLAKQSSLSTTMMMTTRTSVAQYCMLSALAEYPPPLATNWISAVHFSSRPTGTGIFLARCRCQTSRTAWRSHPLALYLYIQYCTISCQRKTTKSGLFYLTLPVMPEEKENEENRERRKQIGGSLGWSLVGSLPDLSTQKELIIVVITLGGVCTFLPPLGLTPSI